VKKTGTIAPDPYTGFLTTSEGREKKTAQALRRKSEKIKSNNAVRTECTQLHCQELRTKVKKKGSPKSKEMGAAMWKRPASATPRPIRMPYIGTFRHLSSQQPPHKVELKMKRWSSGCQQKVASGVPRGGIACRLSPKHHRGDLWGGYLKLYLPVIGDQSGRRRQMNGFDITRFGGK